MADKRKRPLEEQGAGIDMHEGRSQREDDAQGNLASSQRGLMDVQRAEALPDPAVLMQMRAARDGAGMAGAMAPGQMTGVAAPGMAAPGMVVPTLGTAGGMDMSSLDKPDSTYRPAGSRITKEMLQKATRT